MDKFLFLTASSPEETSDKPFAAAGDPDSRGPNKPFEDFCNYYFNLYKKEGLMVDMGCGDKKQHPAFIGIDPYVKDSVDVNINAYMWDTPLADNSVDFLICFSALEHVSKYQVVPSLKEFSRVLKPDGVFAIIVPNFIWTISEFLRSPKLGWEMDLIFGSQLHEGECHKTGFTLELIQQHFRLVPKLKILNIYDVNAYSQINFGIIGKKYGEVELKEQF